MKTAVSTNVLLPDECYVLEIDGRIKSKHGNFTEAWKISFELKQKFPHSEIRVHDANANN